MSEKFPLAVDSFASEERQAVQDVMDSGFYSMGQKVKEFEQAFAKYVGAKNAVMVNSGSSANLLLIASLINRTKGAAVLQPGDEVLVPALSWPTTVWPISQLGLTPVFVDIDPKTLAISVESAQKALSKKTKAMFLIHVLGQSANMDELGDFCQSHGIELIEDCCESFGSYYKQKHVGRFGMGGSFSHFFSHHLTTMEGGTITTDDDDLANDLRSLRAHGWVRDRLDKAEVSAQYPHLDSRFLFVMPGFNVRPMEIQGAIGLVQLKKVDHFLKQRDELAKGVFEITSQIPWLELIGSDRLPAGNHFEQNQDRTHSWMNIPFTLKNDAPITSQNLKQLLEEGGVETRPIIAGNLAKHPAIKQINCRVDVELKNSDHILDNGFMIGCTPGANNKKMLATVRQAFEKLASL